MKEQEIVSDYITSGILQDYCLGVLSDEAERDVDAMCHAHPEVAWELQLLRLSLEKYVGTKKRWRRIVLRKAVWEAIKNLGKENS